MRSAWLCAGFALLVATALSPRAAEVEPRVAHRWTPREISTDQYESSPTFTPDGREMYFMSSDPRLERYRILGSRCEDGTWTVPQPPAFAAPPPVLEADPFVTADGRRLYFVSSRHDVAAEDLDIWYVDRLPPARWSQPRRLPAPVNSQGAELLPRAGAGGRIYFGSNRPGGFGQGDIYVADPGSDGTWRVSNVGAPVSTAANEYEAEVSRDGRTLMLLADRGDRSHLYRFEWQGAGWIERERIPAFAHVFQVGPLLSPVGDRLLFAQADGERSGEIFLIDLTANPSEKWPPQCGVSPSPTPR